MARSTKAKAQKGRNGVGDTLTVYFDCSDPAERKALEAARLLATKHGRRKQAIIALLEAVYTCYEQTGELMSASEISTALMAQKGTSGHLVFDPNTASAALHDLQLPSEITPQPKRQRQHFGGVEVTRAGGETTKTVAQNFLSSAPGLISGMFD